MMKSCPFCAEEIQDEAVKCRYCGEALLGYDAEWQRYCRRYQQMSPEEQRRVWAKLARDQRERLENLLAGNHGRPHDMSASRPGNNRALILTVCAVFITIFVGLALFGPNSGPRSSTSPSSTSPSLPNIGDRAVVVAKDWPEESVPLFRTNEMPDTTERYIRAFKFAVPRDTRVRFAEISVWSNVARVEILEGDHRGREGWTKLHFLERRD
jgi:hypothetical protein